MGKFIVFIVAVLLVIGLWTGGWFYGAGEIRRTVEQLAEADGDSDPKVTCGTLNVSGFPFRFDVECRDATLVATDLTATLAGLRASVLAYNPTQAKFSALSPLTLDDAFSGARSRIEFASTEGSARLHNDDLMRGLGGDGWRVGRISIIADDVEWIDTIVGETQVMQSARMEAHLVDMPEQHDATSGTAALAAYAALEDVTAPRWQIGDGDVTLEAELSGLPDDLRVMAAADVVDFWRQAGGQLKVVGFKGTAGEEFVESSGTLALDSGARLDGQIQVRHRGLVERLGAMIPEEWKGIVLGGQDADGSYEQTLTIKAGVVFSGLVPVSVIPPLS